MVSLVQILTLFFGLFLLLLTISDLLLFASREQSKKSKLYY